MTIDNAVLTWLVPAACGFVGLVFGAGAAWMGVVNQRHAMGRLFKRLEDAEATIDEHDEVMLARGWISRTQHGTRRKNRHPDSED
jgi:hypothetical protein